MAKRKKNLDRPVTSPKSPSPYADVRAVAAGDGALPRRKRKQVVPPKVRKLIGILLDDPDKTYQKAGEEAGYEKKYAARRAAAAIRTVGARELFLREMANKPKSSTPGLAEILEQGLGATVTKFFAHEGQVVDERECADYSARHAYLALAARIAGIDPGNKVDLTTNGKDLNSSAPPQIMALVNLTTEQLLALLPALATVKDDAVTDIAPATVGDDAVTDIAPAAPPTEIKKHEDAAGAPSSDE